MKVAAPPPQANGPLWPIQVIPPGLTGLLQLKQLGRLPDKLSDLVAPVLEMRDWYMTARRQTEFALFAGPPAAFSTNSLGFKTFLAGGVVALVPSNQIWYVEQMDITGVLQNVADLAKIAAAIAPSTGNIQTVGDPDSNGPASGSLQRLHSFNRRPFWAFPGDQLGVDVLSLQSATGITLSMAIRATPMPL